MPSCYGLLHTAHRWVGRESPGTILDNVSSYSIDLHGHTQSGKVTSFSQTRAITSLHTYYGCGMYSTRALERGHMHTLAFL